MVEGQTQEIGRLVKKIHQTYMSFILHEIEGTNLTVQQFFILRCISDQPQMVSTISEKGFLSNSTVSTIIDRLVKKGYVSRIRDSEDRRVVWVTQTEKLAKLKAELPVFQKDKNFHSLLADLDESVVEQIQNCLQLLSDHIEAKMSTYKK